MKAVLIAAGLGAFALWSLGYVMPGVSHGRRRDLATGAALGALVQVGVRAARVS